MKQVSGQVTGRFHIADLPVNVPVHRLVILVVNGSQRPPVEGACSLQTFIFVVVHTLPCTLFQTYEPDHRYGYYIIYHPNVEI